MKKIKTLLAFLMVFTMALGLAACGSADSNAASSMQTAEAAPTWKLWPEAVPGWLGSWAECWVSAGAHLEDALSFPSGHTSLNFAVFTALSAVLIKEKKKWAWLILLIPIVVGCSRIIRCVHYPSDVLGGMIFGIAAGLIGYLITWLFFLNGKHLTGDSVSVE